MIKTISRKFYRLKTSRNYLKFIKIFHYFFGEKFREEIKLPDFYNNLVHRKEIINEIIKLKNFNDYLEIGCDQNELFSEVNIKNKIGIDPNNGGTHRMTSDEFFSQNKEKFDLVFIDGLHTYTQTLKDIKNSINILNNNGFILLHDCFPNTVFDQAVPRCTYKWNGDVWKAIVESRCREDIDTYTCFADQGLGIIFKRPNKNKLNLKIKDFSKLKFKDYFNNHNLYMNIIKYDKIFDIFD